jgi:hypothetical protein
MSDIQAEALRKMAEAQVPDRLLRDVGLKEPAVEREYIVLKWEGERRWKTLGTVTATGRAQALAQAENEWPLSVVPQPDDRDVVLQFVPKRSWRKVTRKLDGKPVVRTEGL